MDEMALTDGNEDCSIAAIAREEKNVCMRAAGALGSWACLMPFYIQHELKGSVYTSPPADLRKVYSEMLDLRCTYHSGRGSFPTYMENAIKLR
eukprot:scaffold84545_cov43-Prasinocladus_malaysianus.AAC.2